MIGYIIKDLSLLWKQSKFLIIFIFGYLIFGVYFTEFNFFISFAFLFTALLPVNTLGYDEKNNFQLYACTLPPSRSTYITAKYVLGLIILAFESFLYIVMSFINMFRFSDFNILAILETISLWCSLPLLLFSIMFPFLSFLGVVKGRIFYMIIFCGGMGALGGIMSAIGSDSNSLPGMILNYTYLFLPASLIIYFISCQISCALYKRRSL